MRTKATVRAIHGKDIVSTVVGITPQETHNKLSDALTTNTTNLRVEGDDGKFYVIPVHNISRIEFEAVDDKVVV